MTRPLFLSLIVILTWTIAHGQTKEDSINNHGLAFKINPVQFINGEVQLFAELPRKQLFSYPRRVDHSYQFTVSFYSNYSLIEEFKNRIGFKVGFDYRRYKNRYRNVYTSMALFYKYVSYHGVSDEDLAGIQFLTIYPGSYYSYGDKHVISFQYLIGKTLYYGHFLSDFFIGTGVRFKHISSGDDFIVPSIDFGVCFGYEKK